MKIKYGNSDDNIHGYLKIIHSHRDDIDLIAYF